MQRPEHRNRIGMLCPLIGLPLQLHGVLGRVMGSLDRLLGQLQPLSLPPSWLCGSHVSLIALTGRASRRTATAS